MSQVAELDTPQQRQADAIDLEIGDVEAARIVIGAVRLHPFDIHARHQVEQVVDVGEAEIIHLAAADHRHRLGRFTQRQVQADNRGGGGKAVAFDHHSPRCAFPDLRAGKAAAENTVTRRKALKRRDMPRYLVENKTQNLVRHSPRGRPLSMLLRLTISCRMNRHKRHFRLWAGMVFCGYS